MKLNKTRDALQHVTMSVSNYIGSLRALYSFVSSWHDDVWTKNAFNEKVALSHPIPELRLKFPKTRNGRALRSTVIVMEELECRLFVIPKLHSPGRNTFDLIFFSFVPPPPRRIVVELGGELPRRRGTCVES